MIKIFKNVRLFFLLSKFLVFYFATIHEGHRWDLINVLCFCCMKNHIKFKFHDYRRVRPDYRIIGESDQKAISVLNIWFSKETEQTSLEIRNRFKNFIFKRYDFGNHQLVFVFVVSHTHLEWIYFPNVKELLAGNRLERWNISDCNVTGTRNHLVCKEFLAESKLVLEILKLLVQLISRSFLDDWFGF